MTVVGFIGMVCVILAIIYMVSNPTNPSVKRW